jgi:FkbM family methyltransferase
MGMGAMQAENKYGKYSIPENLEHRPAVRLVTAGDIYEPKTIRFMAQNAGDGDVIHAGTFFGDFLPGLSAGMAKTKKIWAFEPNPNSFEHAEKTIKLNKIKNVKVQNHALSSKTGAILFRTHDETGKPMGGHSHFVDEMAEGVHEVSSIRLDDAVPFDRKISILQLDVEGHERDAMLGARGIIDKWKPILILEEFKRDRWIKLQFGHHGYRMVGRLHGNRVFATSDMKLN